MSLNFDLSMPDGNWRDIIRDIDAHLTRAVSGLPKKLLPDGLHEVSVVLMDDKMIQTLNLEYRGKDKPTNVLSFPVVNAPGLLGDIVLARETIMKEAQESGKAVGDHVTHLIIHGVLHLLGYDHITEAEAEIMEEIEVKALEKLGIANPYILKA